MSWIKRNLYFLIGSVVAVALMAYAGYYLFEKTRLYTQKKEELNRAYDELKQLHSLKPNPGNDKVNNIQIARDQQVEVAKVLAKARDYFQDIAPIPATDGTTRLGDREFAAELRRTLDQLQHDAQNNSVSLPPRYSFSFETIKTRISFPAGSLEPLSKQLGEVKAIADILIRAKVNSLDSIRRERATTLDNEAQADYIERKSVTNDLAVISPYDLTFRCFSPELAAVISGFAKSTSGFIIRAINIEPAVVTAAPAESPAPMAVVPMPSPAPAPAPPSGPPPLGGIPARGGPPGLPQVYRQSPAPVQTPVAVAAPSRGGLPTLINEKLLKVTLALEVVKLKSDTKPKE